MELPEVTEKQERDFQLAVDRAAKRFKRFTLLEKKKIGSPYVAMMGMAQCIGGMVAAQALNVAMVQQAQGTNPGASLTQAYKTLLADIYTRMGEIATAGIQEQLKGQIAVAKQIAEAQDGNKTKSRTNRQAKRRNAKGA